MPEIMTLHTPSEVEAFVRQNTFVHLYELGDLDAFNWPYTTWYAWHDNTTQQLALIYSAYNPPVLLSFSEPPHDQMHDFLHALLPLLPRRFYAHLDPNVVNVLAADYQIEAHGLHIKMGLTDRAVLLAVDPTGVVQFTLADAERLTAFYAAVYPDSVFNPRTLQFGRYYGITQGANIVSAGGVHVYSQTYGVASLGDIATHPAQRGQGHAARVIAAIGQALLADGIEHIGLNVRADNHSAINLYRRLGFEPMREFSAYELTVRT